MADAVHILKEQTATGEQDQDRSFQTVLTAQISVFDPPW
jgi:hypothetical protein